MSSSRGDRLSQESHSSLVKSLQVSISASTSANGMSWWRAGSITCFSRLGRYIWPVDCEILCGPINQSLENGCTRNELRDLLSGNRVQQLRRDLATHVLHRGSKQKHQLFRTVKMKLVATAIFQHITHANHHQNAFRRSSCLPKHREVTMSNEVVGTSQTTLRLGAPMDCPIGTSAAISHRCVNNNSVTILLREWQYVV